MILNRSGFDYPKALFVLALAAIRQMTGKTFVVRLPEADRSVVSGKFRDDLVKCLGVPGLKVDVPFDGNAPGGGVIVEDGDASQVYDNRLPERLERMWPELRREIAHLCSFSS